MRISAATAVAAILSLAAPARAQDVVVTTTVAAAADTLPRIPLQKGARSLSLGSPLSGGSGELGAWKMVGDRTNLGLGLGVYVLDTDAGVDGPDGERELSETRTAFTLSVNGRRYLGEPRLVTPFVFGGVTAGIVRIERKETGFNDQGSRGFETGARAGFGVEWFPLRNVSLAGHTGLSVNRSSTDGDYTLPDGEEVDAEASSLSVNSFTSGVSLQIWF